MTPEISKEDASQQEWVAGVLGKYMSRIYAGDSRILVDIDGVGRISPDVLKAAIIYGAKDGSIRYALEGEWDHQDLSCEVNVVKEDNMGKYVVVSAPLGWIQELDKPNLIPDSLRLGYNKQVMNLIKETYAAYLSFE